MDTFQFIKDFLVPLSEEEHGKHMRPFIEIAEGEAIDKTALDILSKNKDTIYIKDKDGKYIGKVSRHEVLEYILKHLIDATYLQSMVFDNIQDGVCVLDRNGIVLIWNKAIEKVYGVMSVDILGRRLDEFFPNALDMKVLDSGKSFRDIRHSPREGAQVLISAAPIKKGNRLIGVVSTDRDMEEFMQLQSKLSDAMDRIKSMQLRMEPEDGGKDFFRGEDPAVLEALNSAEMAAPTDVPILITGSTGTGKEVMARYIHEKSGVKGKFVSVNCSAIPETLFESEFFGYKKGAFTGADKEGRAGYFEQANKGTLFLDEVGELPIQQQSKLLRAIQEGFVRPLGGDKDIPVNVRIISATNVDLDDLVRKKEFRIDLFFRLKGITIKMPSLKERREDIPHIINYFLNYFKLKYSKLGKHISREAMDLLVDYDWPGNIREARNLIRQLVVMSPNDEIRKSDIPDEIRSFVKIGRDSYDSSSLVDRLEKIEKSIVESELIRNRGNLAKTAKSLDIPRSTLQYKIKKYSLNTDE